MKYNSTKNDINSKIEEAKALKKALSSKLLIPKEIGEKVASVDLEEEDDEDDNQFLLSEKELWARYEQKKTETIEVLQTKMESYKNPFPVEVFPDTIRDYILDMEDTLNAPREYTAAAVITALAGAIGNKFHAQIKEGLINAPILYVVLIGETGTNKSMPLKAAMAPLFEVERRYAKEFETKLGEYERLPESKKNSILQPKEKRCIVNDTTMEALIELLDENDITVYCDEFQGLLNSMNKYRKGDDMEKWLSIWSSVQIRTDRKSQRGKLINLPFANCIGTIQPDVLLRFLAMNNTSNGYNERLLYVTTDKRSGTSWNSKQQNSELKKRYHEVIKQICSLERPTNKNREVVPNIVKFDNHALERILKWQNMNAEICASIADSELIGIYKKLELYTIRFSLIMAILDYAINLPKLLNNSRASLSIKKQHVEAGIMISEYFRNSAKRVLSLKPRQNSIKAVNKRFLSFFEMLPERFNIQKAFKVAGELRISERSMYNYLGQHYFKQIKRGEYEKAYEFE